MAHCSADLAIVAHFESQFMLEILYVVMKTEAEFLNTVQLISLEKCNWLTKEKIILVLTG